ncbi:protein yellow-like [Schistocerca cancellata]|uniref:protein yellow-like n=1 Tax=Schistocerca cancellata TaxID=274614 RepID=UPI00211792D6|nr:protein yellow-like [Schistocerca cancellata]
MTRLGAAMLLLAALTAGVGAAGKMRVLNAWRTLDFAFPSELTRQAMIRNGSYVPGNSIPIDVQPWQSERGLWSMLVTIPRFKKGVPATLAVVPPKGDTGTPLLPFPDWRSNLQGNCDGFTSVFRVQVDSCGRLWILDTGFVDILTSDFRRICPTKVVVFNNRGEKTLSYEYPHDVLTESSLLVTIAVESRDAACTNNFAYAADVTGFGLVVLDEQRRRSWRVTANYFYPYPQWGHFDLNGDSFDLMDGVLGLALGPPKADGDRDLYFHSMASDRESAVATSVLRNHSLFEDGVNHASREFLLLGEPRPGQTAAEAMDVDGVMFFSVLPRNTLNCWNSRSSYGGRNIVELDRDEHNLQFASGVKVIQDSKGRSHLWVLTCRFQKHMTGTIDNSEINYRILASPVDDLVRGTSCAVRRQQAARPQQQQQQQQSQQRPSYGGPSGGYYGSGGLLFQ